MEPHFQSNINFNYYYINKSLTNCFNSDRLVDWLFSNLLPVQFWFSASLKPFSSRAVVLALVSRHGIIQRQRECVALHSLHTNLPKACSLSVGWTVWDSTVSVHRGHFLDWLRPLFVCPVPDDGEGTGCDVDRTCQLDGIALEDLWGVAGQSHCYVALWKGQKWKNVVKALFSISFELEENAVWISGFLVTKNPAKRVHELLDGLIVWWFCICLQANHHGSLCEPRISSCALCGLLMKAIWKHQKGFRSQGSEALQKSLTFLLLQSCALALLITSLCIKHHGAPVHPVVKATMLWGRG